MTRNLNPREAASPRQPNTEHHEPPGRPMRTTPPPRAPVTQNFSCKLQRPMQLVPDRKWLARQPPVAESLGRVLVPSSQNRPIRVSRHKRWSPFSLSSARGLCRQPNTANGWNDARESKDERYSRSSKLLKFQGRLWLVCGVVCVVARETSLSTPHPTSKFPFWE